MSVPNACVGSPNWVQVAAGVSRTKVTPQEDGSANVAGLVLAVLLLPASAHGFQFVPARCIGAPRWVRLGVRATATPRVYADAPGTVFFLADDGHRGGLRENSIGKGPRIHRG